ncbi:PmoA family protein [Nocardiopsis sp. NPDC101807]|uniref:DUF6807 domain-containing protein n=1 Tax=Nocardiopsis sp. NPDC101807 TaxID=3364339 RepID=UPI00381D98D4
MTASLSLNGVVLAVQRDGADIDPRLSPRPYLHPVRTRGGTEVTEHLPADHLHHLGVGVAVPDVSGVSFWGGRTFVRDRGSVMLDNHGRQEHLAWAAEKDAERVEELSWTGPDGVELLRERRSTRALDLDARTWVLDLRVELSNTSGRDLSIGSPATNGRPGAGYGGLFWRAPLGARPPEVTGAGGLRGEEALHGSRAEWLALAGEDGSGAPWTLLFVQPGERRDPWFLRASDYPGVGPALAWDERLPLPVGGRLERGLRVAVCDGRPTDPASLAEAVGALD